MYDKDLLGTPLEEETGWELFDLDPLGVRTFVEDTDMRNQYIDDNMYYTEAVFENGRKSIQPIIDAFTKVKKGAEEVINPNNDDRDKYKRFWKSQTIKDFEDVLKDTFGFRDVIIKPVEYVYVTKTVERVMNAGVSSEKRYPIDGLVSKNGFYDSTHSIRMDILLTYGILEALEPEELTAILLHEFGHTIDPAWYDIKYHDANALSKYMLDRKNALNKIEEKETQKKGFIAMLARLVHLDSPGSFQESVDVPKKGFIQAIMDFLTHGQYTENKLQKMIDHIRSMIRLDKNDFSRFGNSEAFADNFARMYGLGVPLMRGLRKMSSDDDRRSNSWYQKELDRQKAIAQMTMRSIRDVHKTELHRIYALLKEYEADLKDSTIPAQTKKALREDMMGLRDVLNEYLNNFSDMQKRINRAMNEELQKKYNINLDELLKDDDKKKDTKKDEKKK